MVLQPISQRHLLSFQLDKSWIARSRSNGEETTEELDKVYKNLDNKKRNGKVHGSMLSGM